MARSFRSIAAQKSLTTFTGRRHSVSSRRRTYSSYVLLTYRLYVLLTYRLYVKASIGQGPEQLPARGSHQGGTDRRGTGTVRHQGVLRNGDGGNRRQGRCRHPWCPLPPLRRQGGPVPGGVRSSPGRPRRGNHREGRDDALEMLRRALQQFLDASADNADVQRILLIDGPAVLGWDQWRRLEADYGLGVITAMLEAAVAQSVIVRQPTAPLAHMLLAAVDEAALYIANAPDRRQAHRQARQSLHATTGGAPNRAIAEGTASSPGNSRR